MSSKLDFLKKQYGLAAGGGEDDKKKKKRKKKKKKSHGVKGASVKVVDHDVSWDQLKPTTSAAALLAGETATKKARGPTYVPSGTWTSTTLGEEGKEADGGAASDASPPRRGRARTRHDSDGSDASPPRRVRHDSDASDASPPRRRVRHDSDGSDASPPRRRVRHDSDASDASPPRRRVRHDSDASDASPPRRRARHDSDGSDASPPRRRRPASPPRAGGAPVRPPPPSDGTDGPRMASGQSVGLTSLDDIRRHNATKLESQAAAFARSGAASGRHAETVYRDRRGRRLESLEEFVRQQEGRTAPKEHYEYGVGRVQHEQREREAQRLLDERNKPVARYADDADMNRELASKTRWDDPMTKMQHAADVATGSHKRKRSKSKKKAGGHPPYVGDWAPNRFQIPPGHRWDGRDRSNGFEARHFKRMNARRASQAASAAADMHDW